MAKVCYARGSGTQKGPGLPYSPDDSDLGTDSGGSAKPAETQMWLLVGFISLGFC